jgi:hypothetical protein
MADIPLEGAHWDHIDEDAQYAFRRKIAEARKRWEDCERIAEKARKRGLRARADTVNFQYDRWKRWDEGRLATGYLIKMTGVQRYRDGEKA